MHSLVLRALAPAKINLHLRVGPRGADGFHPLLTWIVTVGLFDTLTIQAPDPAHGAPAIGFSCDDPSLPTDERNLVVRAAQLLLARAIEPSGSAPGLNRLQIHLQKRIP